MSKGAPTHHLQLAPTTHGIAIGKAHLVPPPLLTIPHYWLCQSELTREVGRFQRARTRAKQQLSGISQALEHHDIDKSNPQGILETHLLLLDDEHLVVQTVALIRERAINAEWALEKTVARLAHTFHQMADEYLQQRRYDIEHVGRRVLRVLLGAQEGALAKVPYKSTILFAQDLSPAEIVALPRPSVCGLVTQKGGSASHSAIIARSLGLPALLGAREWPADLAEGTLVILDADQGLLIFDPTPDELSHYRQLRRHALDLQHTYEQERALPATMRDGQPMYLGTNIELLEEVPIALAHGAEFIGMYRTEYLFMNRPDLPGEEEQVQHYRSVLAHMPDHPVTIRTFDLGGDKLADVTGNLQEHNPALGLRSLRFCLREVPLFRTQLRALYRASIAGQLRLLVPMVTTMEEWEQTRQLISHVQQELQQEGYPFDPNIPVGIMIEVPSAVMLADALARQCDFFSLGTNDLTQYTLAVDRTNELVSHLYQSHHPAVLRLIHHTLVAATRHHRPVTVCGEMAGDVIGALLLAGLGVTSLSMNAVSIPRIKRAIRNSTFQDTKHLAARALQAATSHAVEELVREHLRKLPIDTPEAIP